jgi:hypothetical protein
LQQIRDQRHGMLELEPSRNQRLLQTLDAFLIGVGCRLQSQPLREEFGNGMKWGVLEDLLTCVS